VKQSIANKNFFSEKYQSYKGRIYTREIYEKEFHKEDNYMRIGIDREDGKGQIMIELKRRSFEFDILLPYIVHILENDLSFVSPTLEMELVRALKKSREKKDEELELKLKEKKLENRLTERRI